MSIPGLFPFLLQVYLCEKLSLVNEMYFAITLDRKTAGPVCFRNKITIFFPFGIIGPVSTPIRINSLFTWRYMFLLKEIKCLFASLFFFQLIIACRKGGTSIEDLAEKFPDMIIKVVFFRFYSI